MTDKDNPLRETAAAASKLLTAAESSAGACLWQQADAQFTEAISLHDTASIRIAYGVYLFRRERFHEAICTLVPILDGSDLAAMGIVCHNLAAIYREIGDLDLARRFQWRATLLQTEADADVLLALANDAIAVGCLEAAEPLITTAVELNCDSTKSCQDGDLVATRGLLQAITDSPRQGLITLFSAYRLHQRHSDVRRMGTDLLNMANLFGELRRYRAEKTCLLRAIRCFRQVSANNSLERAFRQLEGHTRLEMLRTFDGELN